MRSIRISLGSLLAVLVLLGAFSPVRAAIKSSSFVSTIAGHHATNDGPVALVHFHAPTGAVLSVDGTFALVADTDNHTIRKIVFATGEVTTIAGSAGQSGSADGVGAAASFYAPGGVTLNTEGTFALVADTGNNTIRRFNLVNGSVSTIAGDPTAVGSTDGVGTAARFASPSSVALSADEKFALVADTGNNTIRRIDLVTGNVTTLAGTPGQAGDTDGSGNRALFNGPTSVALGGDSDPFALVADRLNSTIRYIDLSTKVVTTLAGTTADDGNEDGITGAIRFYMPTSVAVSADGKRALVADTGNQVIREIILDTDHVNATTLVLTATDTGAPVTFTQPVGIALSDDGKRGLAVDLANSTLTLIDLAAQSGTPLGVTEASHAPMDNYLNGPEGVAISGEGQFALIANTVNQTIDWLNLSTGATEILAGSPGVFGNQDGVGREATFAYPASIALSADGALAVVADRDNHTIRTLDLATGTVTTLAGLAGESGAQDGIGAEARFTMPQAVAISRDKTYVLVADSFNHAIRRIDLTTGAVTTLAGTLGTSGTSDGVGGAASFSLPAGVALCDSGGYALVADTGNHTIRKLALDTGTITTLAGLAGSAGSADGVGGAARFGSPRGLAIDSACTQAVVADSVSHTMRLIDLASGEVTTRLGASGYFGSADGRGAAVRFDTPMGVAMTASGKLVLVADTGNAAIRYVGDRYTFLPIISR